jgi:hypothetical protein
MRFDNRREPSSPGVDDQIEAITERHEQCSLPERLDPPA